MNFASKDTFKRSNKFRSDLQPRMMTKKIDKMGELNERSALLLHTTLSLFSINLGSISEAGSGVS